MDYSVEEWPKILLEEYKKGWHYVVIGPICNCFTTCWTCEFLGYHTHKGADWADGPWVKYDGPMEEWPDSPFKRISTANAEAVPNLPGL